MAWSGAIRAILPVVVLAGFAYAAYLVTQSSPEVPKKSHPERPQLAVATKIIRAVTQPVSIQSFGLVQPRTQITLVSQVSGQVISVSPSFRSGGYFSKGETLMQIDPVDYQVLVQVAEGEVVDAELALAEEKARVRQAKKDWDKIGGRDTASELALRTPYLKAAEARLATAQAHLTQAKINLERTHIRAPFSGRILSKQVDIGAVVAPQVAVAEIYATDYVEVRLPLKNTDLGYVHIPEPVPGEALSASLLPEVTFYNSLVSPAQRWQGRVVRTEGRVDSDSQQLYVIAQIDDPFGLQKNARRPLKIGQYVSADIAGIAIRDAIIVPSAAIYQGSYVYLVVDDVLVRQSVTTGWQGPDEVLITEGVKAGDEIVLTALGQVSSGIAVTRLNQEISTTASTRAPTTDSSESGTP